MQIYRRWMAVDGGGSAPRPLPRIEFMTTKDCGRSLDCGGQTISPVVTMRLAGFMSRCALR